MKLSIPPIEIKAQGGSAQNIAQQPKEGFLQQLQLVSEKMQGFDGEVFKGKTISPQELISFQIKAHRYALGVELCAKTAEGIANTVRRFHTNQ